MPQQATSTNLFPIRETVYESLVGFDAKTGKHDLPLLAESWSSTDDLLHWTFKLRQGVQFQRGAGEFTSEDVKFTWELITGPESLSTDAPLYRTLVSSIDTPDPYTVTFNLSSPADFAAKQVIWDTNMLIVSKKYYDKVGEKEYAAKPVGTGPYVLDEWNPGQGMKYTYFDKYWGEAPDFEKLDLRFVAEDQTRMSMLQAGEADVADIPRVLVPTAKSAGLKVTAAPDPAVAPILWFGSMYLPDMGGMPWDDVKVREALNIAIDRDALVDGPFDKYAVSVASNILGPNTPGYEQMDRDPYPFDPNKAKQLLADAGYADGLDITVKVTSVGGVPEMPTIVEAVAAQWADVGVKAKIELTEQAPISQGYRDRDRLPYIFTTRSPYNSFNPASLLDLFFHKDGAFGGTDAATSALVEQSAKLIDPKAKAAAWAKVGQAIYDGYWTVPMPAVIPIVAVNPKTVSSWVGTFAYQFDGLTSFKRAK